MFLLFSIQTEMVFLFIVKFCFQINVFTLIEKKLRNDIYTVLKVIENIKKKMKKSSRYRIPEIKQIITFDLNILEILDTNNGNNMKLKHSIARIILENGL